MALALSGSGSGGKVTFSIRVDHSIPIDSWAKKSVQKVQKHAAQDLMDLTKDVMVIAKSTVHVISGTLRRSIKVDRPSDVRERTVEATVRDLGSNIPQPEQLSKHKIALSVGGTTFYAVYEESLHPYMAPAASIARTHFQQHAKK